ncbi:hypothetical protein RvY_16844 [Ramazzottius varieornatus]|uniref:Uncharacterized protein n=1 Tax=Ramazzottius varieornatus TaxID=947166 RepID=A0A1D1W0Z1_RAMVA|nr:hypothetical protein RvY_16844 [Ramazzottius varieornatus]
MASIHSVQALVLPIYPESDLDSVVNGGLDHWPLLTSAELPVPDTLVKSFVGKTSEKVGAAAEDAEERKIQKYQGIAS